jgi:general secretion pathway protein M
MRERPQLTTDFLKWRPSTRGRKILIAVGIVMLGFIGHFFVLVPVKEEIHRLDRTIAEKQEDLRMLVEVREEYIPLRERLRQVEGRFLQNGGGSLMALVEALAGRVQVRELMASMRPQGESVGEGFKETSAEVRLERIRLDQVLGLLTAIDEAPILLRVKQFHFKARFADPGLFDLTLMLSAYEPMPQAVRPPDGTEHGG